jgi:hypothetical protein
MARSISFTEFFQQWQAELQPIFDSEKVMMEEAEMSLTDFAEEVFFSLPEEIIAARA